MTTSNDEPTPVILPAPIILRPDPPLDKVELVFHAIAPDRWQSETQKDLELVRYNESTWALTSGNLALVGEDPEDVLRYAIRQLPGYRSFAMAMTSLLKPAKAAAVLWRNPPLSELVGEED